MVNKLLEIMNCSASGSLFEAFISFRLTLRAWDEASNYCHFPTVLCCTWKLRRVKLGSYLFFPSPPLFVSHNMQTNVSVELNCNYEDNILPCFCLWSHLCT